MYIGLQVKYPDPRKLISNFFKTRPVGDELYHADGRTNGQTYMTKLIVAFRDFANAPKHYHILPLDCRSPNTSVLRGFAFGMPCQMHIQTKHPSFSLSRLGPLTEHPKICEIYCIIFVVGVF